MHNPKNTQPIKLGPFDLLHPLGEGGMSQVWQGVHRTQQIDVAVKIMREGQASKAHVRQGFVYEVQSMAKMQHPGIIHVFDYGHISEETARQSNGSICYEAPYIAMELATRGSLGELNGIFSWRQLRWLLLEILNALAHAHARGLIHRDLKPENVLLTTDQDNKTRLKLTDFGIVHITDPDVSSQTGDMGTLFAGTPYYMSPEQLRGKWREFGPWTDLYSLGCMAFEACCGHPPYSGNNLFDIAHLQMTSEVPPFKPRTPVPKGLEFWIKRMLEKNPHDRFQRAADAAWALLQLPEPDTFQAQNNIKVHPVTSGTPTAQGSDLSDVTWVLEDNPLHTTQNTIHSDLVHTFAEHFASIVDHMPAKKLEIRNYEDAPPLPQSWIRRQPPQPSIQLMEAGLSIYGLREVQYVARTHERNQLWATFFDVHRRQTPAAFIVRGQTGIGKSRLISWIHERAHELGSAIVLQTHHSPDVEIGHGIARMMARELKCTGLPRHKIYKRLKAILSTSATHHETADLDAMALTELIEPGDDSLTEKGPKITLTTSYERYIVVSRLLKFLCMERPVILALDDAQWSHDSLECVRLILTEKETSDLPIFIMLVLNDDAQHSVPATNIESIRKIVTHQNTSELLLAPLHNREQDEFISQLLPLTHQLRTEIKNLSRGNPMFIQQLIGDWIDNNILEVTQEGYALKDGATPFMPTTLNQLWKTRLAKLIRTVRRKAPNFGMDSIRQSLEVSVALGQEILFDEWHAACQLADLNIPDAMLTELVDQGFATKRHDGWTFTHDVLREQIMLEAKQENRWTHAHVACASMIDQLYERTTISAPERLYHHLMEANELNLATQPLSYLIQCTMLRCEFIQAEDYARQLSQTLNTLKIEPHDPRWGVLARQKAQLAQHMDGAQIGIMLLQQTFEQSQQHKWTQTGMVAQHLLAKSYIETGQLQRAHEKCTMAGESAGRLNDPLGLSNSFLVLAALQTMNGVFTKAKRTIKDAIDLIKSNPEAFADVHAQRNLLGEAFYQLGIMYRQKDNWEKATASFKRAQSLFKEVGNRYAEHMNRTQLGHLARDRDGWHAAEKFYLDAHAGLLEMEHSQVHIPHFGYALVLLHQNRFDEAFDMLQEDHLFIKQIGHNLYEPLMHCALCVVHAGRDDLEAWARSAQALDVALERTPLVDLDLARYMVLSANHLEKHRHINPCKQMLQRAVTHYKSLQRPQMIEQLEAQIASLEQAPDIPRLIIKPIKKLTNDET